MILGMLGSLFAYPNRKKWVVSVGIVWTVSLIAQISLLLLVRGQEAKRLSTDICFTVSCIVLPYLMLQPQRKRTFAWFTLLICACADYIEWLIAQVLPVRGFAAEQWIYAAVYTIGAVIVWSIILSGRFRMVPAFPEQVPITQNIVLFLALFLVYYEAQFRVEFPEMARLADAMRMLSVILFIGSLAFVFVLYSKVLHRERETQAQHALELRRYEELMAQDNEVRAFRHDFKNNLLAVSSLLQSGETQQAQKYVDDLSGTLAQTRSRFLTGNLLADAILSEKAAHAAEREIDIRFEGSILASGIVNRDLCTILTNALDNAVEGCAVCAPCAVEITSSRKPGAWLLRIKNPVRERVVIRNGRIATHKSDAKDHGFGLLNMRRAVQPYGGYVDIACTDSFFTTEIGLSVKEE